MILNGIWVFLRDKKNAYIYSVFYGTTLYLINMSPSIVSQLLYFVFFSELILCYSIKLSLFFCERISQNIWTHNSFLFDNPARCISYATKKQTIWSRLTVFVQAYWS